jgi:hypothetical protein
MEKLLTYGSCINWQIVELEDGSHAIRCSSTSLTFPAETDAEGGLKIPTVDGLRFAETEKTATATV